MTKRTPTFSLSPNTPKRSRWRRQKDRRKSASARGYGVAWQKLRAEILEAQPYCQWPGCAERATVVDHILAKRWGGKDVHGNLQGLCGRHHRLKTIEETDYVARSQPRDLMPVLGPLVIISGSPGSGKTTFAEKLVGRHRCLDLDVIKATLAGTPIHNTQSGWIAPALVLRNHSLRQLSKNPFTDPVALILGGPSATERARWAAMLQPCFTCVMETPPDEAIRRVMLDPQRQHCVDEHVNLIRQWWSKHSHGENEVVVTPANAAVAANEIKKSLTTGAADHRAQENRHFSKKTVF